MLRRQPVVHRDQRHAKRCGNLSADRVMAVARSHDEAAAMQVKHRGVMPDLRGLIAPDGHARLGPVLPVQPFGQRPVKGAAERVIPDPLLRHGCRNRIIGVEPRDLPDKVEDFGFGGHGRHGRFLCGKSGDGLAAPRPAANRTSRPVSTAQCPCGSGNRSRTCVQKDTQAVAGIGNNLPAGLHLIAKK